MGKSPKPVKAVDEEFTVRCASGIHGLRREEVWVDAAGNVVRYNLAFIHPLAHRVDNGRVLGYDNAHGGHERHSRGTVERVEWQEYPDTLARFQAELEQLRRIL